MKVSARASLPHYVDHLAPVWKALPEEVRGDFVASTKESAQRARAHGIHPVKRPQVITHGDLGLVASATDLYKERAVGHSVVLTEHGVGQTYKLSNANGSYAGASPASRAGVQLLLCPNERVAEINRATTPGIPSVVVGSPHLDDLIPRRAKHRFNGPVHVVVSFHWDCRVCPETRWAFEHFKNAVSHLDDGLKRRYGPGWVIHGHAHPRAREFLSEWYKALGIPFITELDDVAQVADVFVADNTSALYEMAACNIPVVVMNSPWYRRDVNHGLRFWEFADVGIQVEDPAKLPHAVGTAAFNGPDQIARRSEITAELFPHIGTSAKRASEAIQDLLQ